VITIIVAESLEEQADHKLLLACRELQSLGM